MSNTPSFDIPNNSIFTGYNTGSQLVYDPTMTTSTVSDPTIANRQSMYHIQDNGVNVNATTNLSAVQQTIGSARIIQMSLRVLF